MASGFVMAKVVAIYTGPSGIAMLGQVQSLVSALSGIVAAPTGTAVVRYTAEHQSQGLDACAPWWKAALKWSMVLSGIVIPAACIFAKPLSFWILGSASHEWLIVLIALALPLSVANSLVASVVNGQQQYGRFVWLGMISVIVSTIAMVFLVVQQNLNGAMIAAASFTSMSGLVMLLGSFRQPWFRLKYWWGKAEKVHLIGIAGYVAMAVTSALTVPVALLIVRNILVAQVGWEEAGHWQAVWKISEVYLGVITMALSTYFLPRLASVQGADAILREINITAKAVMPIVVAMAVVVYLFRDTAIRLIFTADFYPARDLFAVQLVGDVVKILSWLYAYPMLSHGATRWYMGTEMVFSATFVMFSYVLAVRYGVDGVNMAYALNYSLCLIFVYKNVKRFSQ